MIGCANGAETTALLSLGWTVIGIDEDPDAHEKVRALIDEAARDRLTSVVGSAADQDQLPEADLVLTRTALLGEHAASLWPRIVAALRPGGILAARLTESTARRLRGWELLSERYTGATVEVVARRP